MDCIHFVNLQNHPTFKLRGQLRKRKRVFCWSIYIIRLCPSCRFGHVGQIRKRKRVLCWSIYIIRLCSSCRGKRKRKRVLYWPMIRWFLYRYGQTYLCLSLPTSGLEQVGRQLTFTVPYIYSTSLPAWLSAGYPTMLMAAQGQTVRSEHRVTTPRGAKHCLL